MVTSAVIVTLLTIVASLASWLLSQWLARRARVSGLALALGGVGTALLKRRHLAVHRGDADVRSLMARAMFAAQHPGPASIIPAAIVAEWPATDCVESARADESSHWVLDNGCGRVVAVLFASCRLSETACFTNALVRRDGSTRRPGFS